MQTDGWIRGRVDGETDGWMGERTARQTVGRMDRLTDRRRNGPMGMRVAVGFFKFQEVLAAHALEALTAKNMLISS